MLTKWIYSLIAAAIILMMNTNSIGAESPLASSSRVEGVLVVDVSKSMLESDPNKISNEAMKMFVDMSSLKGDKIGVVAYANEVVSKKDLVKLQAEQDKQQIKDFIDSLEKFPNTDLSAGINEAVKDLEKSHEKNYRPLIVLLADGNNDLNPKKGKTTQQANDDLNAAVAAAKEKGFPIYVIGLNASGDLNRDVLQNISGTTNGKYFETSNADDLPKILSEIFADHLKLKIVPMNEQVGNGDFQDTTITVPNDNIFEANISLISDQAVEVKLFDPSGKEIAIPSDNILLSKSASYSMLKVMNPAKGNWTLKVKSSLQDKVDIKVVFNYDLQLKLAPIDTKGIKEGDIINVAAYFEDNGEQISNKELYSSMKATLLVKDLKTGKTETIQLGSKDQGFTGQFIVGNSTDYKLSVKAEGNSFYREIQPTKISFQTEATPAIKNQIENLPVTIIVNIIIALAAVIVLTALVYYLLKNGKKNGHLAGKSLWK